MRRKMLFGLAAAALLAATAAGVWGQGRRGSDQPPWIVVQPTKFERVKNPRAGDKLVVLPNETLAINELVAMGYEPVMIAEGMIVGRRR